ncbi:dienelactone hydrolase family protein [Salsipaludibacter albus]|uniref:dienelactone hydrolase family protein n=1 Tax=Salsipaludibacter albus TaxID=2849650 RepID=UPI001EE3D8EA|nr:dienelactone hydrolase family protein [Salsipaludibacter albus]MBY5163141.1 dienelactone hydrolase family protein [Salsipaludibacter albus]
MSQRTRSVAHDGRRFEVVSYGEGPPVVLLHELHGVSTAFHELACMLQLQGYSVHVPLLYGDSEVRSTLGGAVKAWSCLRREMALFSAGGPDKLTNWLNALIAELVADPELDASRGVAVIGMCMTGGIVLGTLANESTATVISSQPSSPMRPWSPTTSADLGLSDETLEAAEESDTPLLCLRYRNDPLCGDGRFDHIRTRLKSTDEEHPLGEWQRRGHLRVFTHGRLTTVEVPGSRHSVLTSDRDPEALALTVEWLAKHLLDPGPEPGSDVARWGNPLLLGAAAALAGWAVGRWLGARTPPVRPSRTDDGNA